MAVDEPEPGPPAADRPVTVDRLLDVCVGGAAVGLTVTIGQAAAVVGQHVGLLHPPSAPVTALGNAFISVTPDWLSEWAIRSFGVHDKQVLLAGVFVTFALLALLLGLIHRKHPHVASSTVGLLVVITLIAVWSNTDTGPADGVPTIIGSMTGIGLLVLVGRRPGRRQASLASSDTATMMHRRRRVLLTYVLTAFATATGAGLVARFLPTTGDVEASRARIRIGGAAPTSGATSSPPAPIATDVIAPPTSGTQIRPLPIPASTTTASSAPTTAAPTKPFATIEGLASFITPNENFYRIDTTLSPPLVRAEDWSLRIHGRVAREVRMNYQQLTALPQLDRTITLGCVSNPVGGHLIGNAVWTGARLDDLLAQAQPLLGADCVLSTSIDGFTCSTPLGALIDGRDALLAVGMNGEPLPIEHGFPVRMIVPGLFGYASATKWVVDLEVTTFAEVTAYWTARGYARLGPVKIASRIDVPVPYTSFGVGSEVTIAGAAWAQHTGIAAVQVRVDTGPWVDAELETASSPDTWRLWRYRWRATAGTHTVQCRALDGLRHVQDATPHDPLPDGATGYASVLITVG